MTPPGVDKGTGLAQLLNKLSWPIKSIIAAGDGENDLPLFNHAAVSFSVYDAPEHIRTAADHIVDVRGKGVLSSILALLEL
jgi:hypothetical protein